ncbi:MAG: hypothetical protein ACFFCW_42665, partial [Candidatus Hodarchaeota archaeon]
GFVFLISPNVHFHIFTCYKRAYVDLRVLDFGFVLHFLLIISYVIFRRFCLVCGIRPAPISRTHQQQSTSFWYWTIGAGSTLRSEILDRCRGQFSEE